MAKYDLHQQTFALSMAVNAAYNDTGSASELEKILKGKLNDMLGNATFQGLVGQWSLAWGPAVWKHPLNLRGYSDNAAVVFHNAASNTYVCAIAATNSNSIFDWAVEDFWVSDKVRWLSSPASNVPWISAATNFGIGMLQTLRDPATKTFLADYLASVASTSASLVFAGHSLAGALSPTLALTLYGTPQARQAWGDVLVYPTAGATPGNSAFAAAFAAQFPTKTTGTQPWQHWNALLWNSLDVVPHAWGVGTMALVPFLYKMVDLVKVEVGAIVTFAVFQAGLEYQSVHNVSLKGTQKSASIADFNTFLTEMGYQHVDAYLTLLGVPELAQFMPTVAAPSQASALAALGAAKANAAAVAASAVPEALKLSL